MLILRHTVNYIISNIISKMCLCAKGKQKPAEQMQRPIVSSTIPKSTVLFSGNDYDGKKFTEQANFSSVKRAEAYATDRLDRDSHYHEQVVGTTSKSKLIQPKQFLNYDLDAEDGVSKTCVVNTFHYQSMLNHCFINSSGPTTRESRQRTGNYQSSSPPLDSMNRNTIRSQLDNRSSNNRIM